MRIFSSRPALRWLAPLAFVLAISGTALVATNATAERKLPTRTAEQLLVDVQQAKVDGLSGTVIQRANLGIPEIPGAGENSDLGSLVSGTHTLRVRYSECDPQGVVFNANYVAYLDVVITELWREALGRYQDLVDSGVDMVVAEVNVRYLGSAAFDMTSCSFSP